MKISKAILYTLIISFFFTFATQNLNALVKYPPEYAVLPNGLRIIAIEDNSLPIISAGLFFNVKPYYENCKNNGIARIYKQLMLSSGLKNESRFDFNERLEKHGISKDFSDGQDIIYVGCTATAVEIDKILSVIFSLGYELKPDSNSFDSAKAEAIRFSKSQKKYPRATCLLEQKTWQRVYTSKSIEYNCPIDDGLLTELTLEDLAPFTERVINPNNSVLVVAGNLKTSAIFKAVMEKFGKLEANIESKQTVCPPNTEQCKIIDNAKIVEYADIKSTEVIIGFEAPAFDDPDMPAAYMWQTALNDYHKFPLKATLLKDFPEIDNFSARYLPGRERGIFVIGFTNPDDNIDRPIYSIISEVKNLKNQIPTKNDLNNIIEIARIKNLEKLESRIDRVFYLGVAEIMGNYKVLERFDSELNGMDSEKMLKAYERIFVGKRQVISVIRPSKYKKYQENNIYFQTLSNGAKILVNNYPGSELSGFTILINTQTTEKNRITPLFGAMVAAYINDEREGIADNGLIGARIDAEALSDCLIIRGKIRNNRLLSMAQYIKNLLLDNKFYSHSNFERVKQIVIEEIEKRNEVPIKKLERHIRKKLIGKKTYEVSKEEISKIQYEEAKENYKKWVVASDMNIVAVGNLNPTSTLKELAEIFSSFPSGEKKEDSNEKNSLTKSLQKTERDSIQITNSPETSYIAVAFKLPPVADRNEFKDFAANSVLAHTLYGSSNSIIKQELTKINAYQSVWGNIATNKTCSIMTMYASVPVKMESEAVKVIEKIVSNIPNMKISKDQILATKMKVISEFTQSVEKSDSRSNVIAFLLWNGLKENVADKLITLYSELAPEDVYNATKKYYNNYYLLLGKPSLNH